MEAWRLNHWGIREVLVKLLLMIVNSTSTLTHTCFLLGPSPNTLTPGWVQAPIVTNHDMSHPTGAPRDPAGHSVKTVMKRLQHRRSSHLGPQLTRLLPEV